MDEKISINKDIGINRETGFLYKCCKKIKPGIITKMALVPEFIEVIKSYNGHIDDEVVYNLLRQKAIEMHSRGKGGLYRTARDVMKKVSRDVRGDTHAWETEEEKPLKKQIRINKETGFLYNSCKKIKPSVITDMALVPEFIEVIKSYDGHVDDDVVYELLRQKAIEMYNLGSDGLYDIAKDVIERVSRDVKGNKVAWKSELRKQDHQ